MLLRTGADKPAAPGACSLYRAATAVARPRIPIQPMSRLSPTQRVALAVAATYFTVLLDSTILHTSLPRMATGLGVAPLSLALAVTIYLLAAAAVMPSCGWLSDRFGPRRCFIAGLWLFTLSSALCGHAQNLPELVIARAVQGTGGGLLVPLGRILTVRQASKAELMQATALMTWPALLAPVLGPALGGYISTYLEWRWNFWLNLPIGAAALFACARVLPQDPPPVTTPFDLKGAVLAALGSASLLGGLETAAHARQLPLGVALPVGLIGVAVLLLALLQRHLTRTEWPLVRLTPLSVRTFAVATLAGGLPFAVCLQATPFLLPLMFQLGMGWSAVEAGTAVLYYFLGNLLIKPVTTPLLRRIGFRPLMIACALLNGATIAACGTFDATWHTAWVAPLLFVTGACRSVQLTALNTLMFADIAPAQRSSASTLSSVLQQLGSAFGVAGSTLLLTLSAGLSSHLAPQQTDFRNVFFVVGSIAALCALLFARLHRDDGAEVSGQARASQVTPA